jgi:hypothetical protein
MHGPINVKSPNNTSKWQIGFNSAFKGLSSVLRTLLCIRSLELKERLLQWALHCTSSATVNEPGIPVCTMTILWARESSNSGSVPGETKHFSLFHSASRLASVPTSLSLRQYRLFFHVNKTVDKCSQIFTYIYHEVYERLATSTSFSLLWHCGKTWAMASSFLRFLDHTRRVTTVGLLWMSDQLVAETSI